MYLVNLYHAAGHDGYTFTTFTVGIGSFAFANLLVGDGHTIQRWKRRPGCHRCWAWVLWTEIPFSFMALLDWALS